MTALRKLPWDLIALLLLAVLPLVPGLFDAIDRELKIPFGSELTTLFIMAIGAFLPYSPLATTLGFVPLPPLYWLLLLLTLLGYVGLTQIVKTWLIRKLWI